MQFRESQRHQSSSVIKLCSNIAHLSFQDEISEGLIVSSLNIMKGTSAPLLILLKSLEDSSFKRLVLEAVQLSIFLILTPIFLESIPSESNLKAAFQLS